MSGWEGRGHAWREGGREWEWGDWGGDVTGDKSVGGLKHIRGRTLIDEFTAESEMAGDGLEILKRVDSSSGCWE